MAEIQIREAEKALASDDLASAELYLQRALTPGYGAAAATRQRVQQLLAEVRLQQARQAGSPFVRLELLNEVVQKSPQHAGVHYELGLTLWRMGQFSPAALEFKQVKQETPEQPDPRFLQQLGNLASQQPWHKEGLRAAEVNTLTLLQDLRGNVSPKVLKDRPAQQALIGGADAGWAFLLELLADAKATPLAANQAPNPVLRYYQGVAALRAGDANRAFAAWLEAGRTIAPPWLVANLSSVARNLAFDLAQAQQWQGVIDLYERAASLTGPDENAAFSEVTGTAHFQLGFADAQAGRWSAAVEHFRTADALLKSRYLSQNLALAEEALEQWHEAAEAWRETVRRRPRKQDHPDALTDDQVAAIWERAAHCYLQYENMEETIVCLKNAAKYAPGNLPMRINLVDAMLNSGREDAAINELDRILDKTPNHVPALLRLGRLLTDQWGRDSAPIWRQILAIEPNNTDAQQGLARTYVERAHDPDLYRQFHHGILTTAEQIALLEQGLREIPNHPELLLSLGTIFAKEKKKEKARHYLQQAARQAQGRLELLEIALHELLHVDGDAIVQELVPQVSALPGLRPVFWLDQVTRVFKCKLGDKRAELFVDAAMKQANGKHGDDAPAAVLLAVFDICHNAHEQRLAKQYEQVLRSQYSATGAPEYIDARYAFDPKNRKNNRAVKLLERAKSKALSAKEQGIVNMTEEYIDDIKNPIPFNPLSMNPIEMMRMLSNLSEEELNDILRGI